MTEADVNTNYDNIPALLSQGGVICEKCGWIKRGWDEDLVEMFQALREHNREEHSDDAET